MNYWRMQLHPGSDSDNSLKYVVTSLAAGYVGLDFATSVGDLRHLSKSKLAALDPGRDFYWDFYASMRQKDIVLVIAHDFPFALVKVTGDYMYKSRPPHGLWFRHMRRVQLIEYYGNWQKNPHNWKRLEMPSALQRLTEASESFRFIHKWLRGLERRNS